MSTPRLGYEFRSALAFLSPVTTPVMFSIFNNASVSSWERKFKTSVVTCETGLFVSSAAFAINVAFL